MIARYNISEPVEISGKEAITQKDDATTMGASLPQSQANHLRRQTIRKSGYKSLAAL